MANGIITNWLKRWQVIFWIVGVIIAVTLAFGQMSNSTKRNVENINTLKVEGCKPAVKNTLEVALMKKDIVTMKEDISEMRTEQREGFKEILKRLPE